MSVRDVVWAIVVAGVVVLVMILLIPFLPSFF
jgi:hypothetical protein